VWFQNRRTKWRKKNAAEMSSAYKKLEKRAKQIIGDDADENDKDDDDDEDDDNDVDELNSDNSACSVDSDQGNNHVIGHVGNTSGTYGQTFGLG